MPSTHHRTNLSSYIFPMKACIDNPEKKLVKLVISSSCCHNNVNFGLLTAEIGKTF